MNILKVEVLRFTIINLFYILFFFGCKKIVNKSELTFNNCKVYFKGKEFTGEFEISQADKYILTEVNKGLLKKEKTFKNNNLLMEKSFDSCNKGYQIIFNPDGKLNSEGYFLENNRIGSWKYHIKDSMYTIKY